MRTGFSAINDEISRPAGGGGGNFAGRLGYANWKDQESKILRFLSPDPYVVGFHEMITDIDGKPQTFICAPDLHSEDPNWTGEDWVLKYGGKTRENGLSGDPVASTPRTKGVAVAVLREEVPRTVNGKTVTEVRDVLDEVEIDGKKYPSRKFVVVKQGMRNFWNSLVGYESEYGTVCDRDYKITRQGGGMDTTYRIVPKSPDADFSLESLQARYGYGTGKNADGEVLGPDHPERFLFCPQTLQEWAEYFGSEERVKHFLVGDHQAPAPTTTVSSGGDEAQADSPSGTDFDALRSQLESHR